jgi:LuxR family maltose regulon positive regulatory protein
VEPATRSGTASVPLAPAVRGGIVSRRALFGRLAGAGRVAQVSAPAGSGKTFLLRSWAGAAGLADSVAWVAVQGRERDPQRHRTWMAGRWSSGCWRIWTRWKTGSGW